MSQQHIDLWKTTAAAFDERYQAIGDQWETQSPCAEWTVRGLIDHAVGVQAQFAGGMVGAEIGEGAEWPEVHQAILAALDTEGVLDGNVEGGPMGDAPKTMMFGIATSDLLVHAWDVARSIGADETLPAEAVTACYMGMQKMPPQMMRAEGRFGPEVEVADDADEQTKFIAFTGRQI